MLQEITAWRCDTCDAVYLLKPSMCYKCGSPPKYEGTYIILEDEHRARRIRCRLCGEYRLDTCNCKPSHIEIEKLFASGFVQYTCGKCKSQQLVPNPIKRWCCNE